MTLSVSLLTWQDDFLLSARTRGAKESSTRVYGYMLAYLAKKLDFRTASKEELLRYLDQVQASRSQRHHRNLVVLAKAALKHLGRQELADAIPLPKLPDPATEVKKKIIPPDERKKLIEAAPTLMDRLIFLLLDETRGRRHEINSLTLKDVQFDNYGAILTLTGKSGTRVRRVYAAVPDLRQYINNHPDRSNPDARLFPFASDMTFYHHVIRTTTAILGHPVNPHRWRHTGATEDAKNFTDQEMMKLNGWKRADVIRVYAHLSMRDVEDKDLILHGLKRREEAMRPITEVRTCAKGHQNAPIAIYCHECGQVLSNALDEEAVVDYLEKSPRIAEIILKLVDREKSKSSS